MRCHWTYKTPEGFDDLVMVGDDEALTGLAFKGSRGDWWRGEAGERRETPAFRETRRWLDAYFAGRDPGFTPPFRIEGATQFRRDVLDELMKIPFGATTSYGDIAKAVARRRGGKKASARAVGGAVGWNPIGIIIPCHRVVGSDGGLTGYGGGLGNKVSLLAHEGADLFDARISAPTDAKTEIDEKRVRLCLLTVNKAAARHGLGRAKCDRDGGSPMIRLDGIIQFGLDAPYIFGECGDEEAKTLLESFMDFQGLYHYDLALQLARLMAEKGVRGWAASSPRRTGARTAAMVFCCRILGRGNTAARWCFGFSTLFQRTAGTDFSSAAGTWPASRCRPSCAGSSRNGRLATHHGAEAQARRNGLLRISRSGRARACSHTRNCSR